MSDEKGATNIELIRLLCASAYAAYASNLNGTTAGGRLHDWFRAPQPGDLVLEVSSTDMGDERKKIGHLVRVGYEPMYTDEEWSKIKGDWGNDPRPTEKVWYIRLLYNGEECRWTNADFVRVATSIRRFWDIQHPPRLTG